jgi:hypothetical protein
MNHHVEKQRRSPVTENRLSSMLENVEQMAVTLIVVPMPAPCDRTGLPATGYGDEDLANATWEDAEWQ